MSIHKHDKTYKQKQGQKTHNPLNRCRKKTFDKIQHPFIIKILKKLGIEGMFPNTMKAIYDKPRAKIILTGELLKLFPLKSGMR
jgi:hypothetical protein